MCTHPLTRGSIPKARKVALSSFRPHGPQEVKLVGARYGSGMERHLDESLTRENPWKCGYSGGFLRSGAGFEPATFGS